MNIQYHKNNFSTFFVSRWWIFYIFQEIFLNCCNDFEYSTFLNICQFLTVTLLTGKCFMHTQIHIDDETEFLGDRKYS